MFNFFIFDIIKYSMNIVLAGTVVILAFFGLAIFMLGNFTDTTIQSNESQGIEQQKSQEEIFAEYDGNDITVINRGKETSEIIKYRFYDDNEQLIKEISSGGGSNQLSKSNSTLDVRSPVISDIWPKTAVSGEIITKYGNVIPIEYQVQCQPFKIQNRSFACVTAEVQSGNVTIPTTPPKFKVCVDDNCITIPKDGGDVRVQPDPVDNTCKVTVNDETLDVTDHIEINNQRVQVNECSITIGAGTGGGGSGGGDYTIDDRVIGAGVVAGMSSTGKFVNHQLSGRIFEGGSTLLGEQHANVPAQGTVDTIWVSYVGDGDKKISNNIVLDYTPYVYNKNSETLSKSLTSASFNKVNSFDMNVISHKQGSPSIHLHQSEGVFPEWIKYKSSSPSMTIIKLPDHLKGQNVIFHTFLEKGMSVEIVNSIYSDLLTKQYQNGFVLYEGSTSNTPEIKAWWQRHATVGDARSRHFDIYSQMPVLSVGGVLTSNVNNVRTTGVGGINVQSSTSGDYVSINSISSTCNIGAITTLVTNGYYYTEKTPTMYPGSYPNYYYTFHPKNKDDGWSLTRIYPGPPFDAYAFWYCSHSTLNAKIIDPTPYKIISSHVNNNYNSLHVRNNVQVESYGTNYMIIKYNGDTSLGNTNTLLYDNHIFSFINKHYDTKSDITKKLTSGVNEANVLLMLKPNTLLNISNLPPNIPYEIKQSGNVLVTGFTSTDGKIVLNNSQLTPSGSGTITLILYPNSDVYQGTIIQDDTNAITYDPRNKYFINMNGVDNQIYVAQGYIRYTISSAVDISNVTLHKGDKTVSLDGLNRHYEAGSKMYVPLLPGYLTITMDINGVHAKFYMHDLLEGAYASSSVGDSRVGGSNNINQPSVTDLSGITISTKDKTAVKIQFNVKTSSTSSGTGEKVTRVCSAPQKDFFSYRRGSRGSAENYYQYTSLYQHPSIGSNVNVPGTLSYTVSYQINGGLITSLPTQTININEITTYSYTDMDRIKGAYVSGGHLYTAWYTFSTTNNFNQIIQYTFNIPSAKISDQIRVIVDVKYNPGYSFDFKYGQCSISYGAHGFTRVTGTFILSTNVESITGSSNVQINDLRINESGLVYNNPTISYN